jgi:hypothetical protein
MRGLKEDIMKKKYHCKECGGDMELPYEEMQCPYCDGELEGVEETRINLELGVLEDGRQFLQVGGDSFIYDKEYCPDRFGVHWGYEPIRKDVLEGMKIKSVIGMSY